MNKSKRWIWYFTIGVLLIAFALRVHGLEDPSIWWDEGHSIQMASAEVTQIPTLPGMDVHPPGYFVALHQWMSVAGRSEFALRYLSVVFSLLTVALLIRFGRALDIGWKAAWIGLATGGLGAISPLYVAYAQEVRMYAMVTFFALVSAYFQWRIVTGEERRRVPIIGHVLATAASLYTHYFTIFLLLFQNLAWLVWALASSSERRRRVAIWLGSQLATLFLFLPQLPLALRQTTSYANPNLNPPTPGGFVSRSWLTYTIGEVMSPPLRDWLAWGLVALLGAALLAQVVARFRQTDVGQPGTVAFLIGWFLLPLVAYFLVVQRRPSFEPRYMMLVTPSLMLLFIWGFLGGGLRRLGWAALGIVPIFAAFGLGTWTYFANLESLKDDSAAVTEWLAIHTTPNDVVYVDVPHPFHYYADRIPAPTRYLFVDIHTAADVLNAEASGRDRLFWVTWYGSDTDPRGVIPFLLDKAAHRGGEADFRGYRVTWWDLPPDAHFSLPNELSPLQATFSDVIRLDGVAFSDTAQVGESAWGMLHFALLQDTGVNYRVSLRLRNGGGDMLPPTDKDLLNDRHFRTADWPLDDPRLNQAINVYTLVVPVAASPGEYRLEAVIYAADTLEALPVAGAPTADGMSAFIGSVAILP